MAASTRKVTRGVTSLSNSIIGGYKATRYEKLEECHGTILSGTYYVGDTISFPLEPSSQIIRASFKPTGGTLVEGWPSTNYSSAIAVASNSGANIDYVIMYKRGTGNVGVGTNVKILTS